MNLSYLRAKRLHKNLFGKRWMERPGCFYFSYKDFPTLECKRITFKNKWDDNIAGFIYNYPNYKQGKLIIFLHGICGGHRNYMKEIEFLCSRGFQVLGYDITGSWASEGKNPKGFYEHVSVLKNAINFLRQSDEYKDTEFYIIGHSLGGYSVLQGLYFPDEMNVKKIVAISGFKSIKTIGTQRMQNNHLGTQKAFLEIEKSLYGDAVFNDASSKLKDTQTKVLIIQSDDDNIVSYPLNFLPMQAAAKDNKNVKCISVTGHSHNPTYSLRACKIFDEYFGKLNKIKSIKKKNEMGHHVDWNSICELDQKVMTLIVDFLNDKDI